MILYEFACPVDGLDIDLEATPLTQQGGAVAVGKHIHLNINQPLTCTNGHVFTLHGDLLLSRSV